MSAIMNMNNNKVGNMEVQPPKNDFGTACMEFEFDEETLEECWERLGHNSFAAESCFFNCQSEEYKDSVLDHLDEVESAMTDYAQCVFEWLHTVKFVEKSRPVPPLPVGFSCNQEDTGKEEKKKAKPHPVSQVTHVDIVAQIQQFQESQNMADLMGLKYKVEVMKECVRIYVESNRVNTEKYIIEENDPDYTCYPAWMFFPILK
jgi:hypothetical protein